MKLKEFYILIIIFLSMKTFVILSINRALLVDNQFPSFSTQILTTIIMLQELGYEVYIYPIKRSMNLNKKQEEYFDKLGVSAVFQNTYTPGKEDLLIKDFENNKFNIVVGMLGDCGLYMARLKKKYNFNFPLFVKYTGADISRGFESKKKKITKYLDYINCFLPVSESLKDLLLLASVPEDKIEVLFSVVLSEFFNKKRLDKNKKNFCVISVGRLVEKKGFKYAIKAMKKIIDKYPFVSYEIIGDGELYNELNNLIRKLKCKNIRLVGQKDIFKIPYLMRNSEILLCTSCEARNGDSEGIPRVIKEAMAIKLPVIATDHSGIKEIVFHGQTGLLVKSKNTKKIAMVIDYAIKNYKKIKKMTINAKKNIKKYHALNVIQDQLGYILLKYL